MNISSLLIQKYSIRAFRYEFATRGAELQAVVKLLTFSVYLAGIGAFSLLLFTPFVFVFILLCLTQPFLRLPLPSPCCCAPEQRWCWAGGPPRVTGETPCTDTTWTRWKRAPAHGGRSTSNPPKRGCLRSVMVECDARCMSVCQSVSQSVSPHVAPD